MSFAYSQAAPILDEGITGKKRYIELLDHALVCQEIRSDPLIHKEAVVCFCVTVLNRDDQVLTAALVNCCLWWPLRRHWRMTIVTFGHDEELQNHLREVLALPIEVGCVTLASGGDSGKRLVQTQDKPDKPSWMPKLPEEALPAGSEGTSNILGMPLMQYWHASVAKNTAHVAALHAHGQCCLVSLDCDQLVPLEYVSSLLRLYTEHHDEKGFIVKCYRTAGSLTGRIAYRSQDFFELNGYDDVQHCWA